MYLLDITSKIGQGGSTSAEQHPWPISTVTVDDFSGRPNFCSRGTRFGVHSPAENFEDPSYARLLTSAWFDAGIRVHDIRDPYHPAEVAHFIAPVNHFTQPSSAAAVAPCGRKIASATSFGKCGTPSGALTGQKHHPAARVADEASQKIHGRCGWGGWPRPHFCF
jgi:hypothetical protein